MRPADDGIAQKQHFIPWAGVLKDGLQGGQIGVNVSKHENAHGRDSSGCAPDQVFERQTLASQTFESQAFGDQAPDIMKGMRMRLAFIGGCGHHYLRQAMDDPPLGVTSVAVSGDGHDDAAARRFAEQLDNATWFDEPAAMLDTFRPDIVSVGAVYGHNAAMAGLALQRDLPVISDKPVAASWAQLDRLNSLLRGTQRVLLTEFDFRSRACFRAARQAVAVGRIGQPVLATAQKSYRFGRRPRWYAEREDYGGTMLWIASHGIDAIRFVTDLPMCRVYGRSGNLSRSDRGSFEDHVVAMFELEGGATGIVHADFLRPTAAPSHGDDRLRVAGTDGLVEVRDGRCTLMTTAVGPCDITDEAVVEPMHRELLAAVRDGGSAYYSTAATLELAAVMLAARDAADRREPVVIETPCDSPSDPTWRPSS